MLGRWTLAVAFGLLAMPVPSSALPLYAAREQKACGHCHVDPGGSGPRNGRGQYYESHDHAFEGFDESAYEATAALEAATPLESLLKSLSFSGNLRILYSLSEGPHLGGGQSCESCHTSGGRAPDQTFLLMQGEIGVSARVSDAVSFVYTNDLGLTRDVYGVLRLGESGAFVKAGIFEVPYGIEEIRDHNALVKSRHGIGSNLRDVGVAVAVQKPNRFASVAVMNGGQRLPDFAPVLSSSIDQNGSPSIALRGGLNSSRVRVGASFLFDDSLAATRARQMVGGLFGTVFAERWRASAEVDLGNAKLGGRDASNLGVLGLLTWSPCETFEVSAQLDRYDPDTDTSGDGETWYSAIVERDITRNASVQLRYRVRDEEAQRADGSEIANNDFLTMLYVHF